MNRAPHLSALLTALLLCLSPTLHAQVPPSANKGRTGTYSVDTDISNYKYFVYVPKSYDGTRPAGIHLFFHGQNSQAGAPNFGQWSKTFLEPFNLIGINMQYNDGDNYKDTDNKVRVAIRAVMQVSADYKTLPYGTVASMSGGGQTLGLLYTAHGKPGPREPFWPFQHCSIYSSNFRVDARGGRPMSWFIGLGGKEWNKFTIGQSQTARAAELFADTGAGGCPDVYLRFDPARDHTISDGDVAASAVMYKRSSLAFTPFVYPPDFSERELQPIVKNCNDLLLGKAAVTLQGVLTRSSTAPAVKEKAQSLKALIDERVDADLSLCQQLAKEDPVLCAYYATLFSGELAGHPRIKELNDLIAAARTDKTQRTAAVAWTNFARGFPGFFGSKPDLKPGVANFLEQLKTSTPAESQLGMMAGEFLELK